MGLKQALKILILIGAIFAWAGFVWAGFGVSPPWVIAEHLLKGSHFEQTIYLVQGQPDQELIARVKIDDSPVKSWVSIDRGMEFKIPAGVQQFPIKVIVDVPKNAALGDYKGSLRVQAGTGEFEKGVINVVLGSVIDLKLKVTEEEFLSFIIRSAKIKKIEESWPVKIYFNVENTGNINGRPTKATLEVWDIGMNRVLASGEFADFDYVEPFKTKEIIAQFPANLSIGQYWGVFKIYYNNVALRQDKAVFDVLEKGSLSGWRGLLMDIKEWLTWQKSLSILFGLIALAFLIWLKKKFKIKIISILLWPVRLLKKLFKIRISFKE